MQPHQTKDGKKKKKRLSIFKSLKNVWSKSKKKTEQALDDSIHRTI